MEPQPRGETEGASFDLVDRLNEVGRPHVENDFTYCEVDDPETFLNQAALAGYLLHGSSLKLSEVEPRQANDTEKESGRRLAIYMTDAPAVAMFSALRGGIPLGTSQHGVSREVDGNKIEYKSLHFAVQNPHMLADQGYVYIFKSGQAGEMINGEHLSYEAQRPIATIAVKRSDFHYPIETIEG